MNEQTVSITVFSVIAFIFIIIFVVGFAYFLDGFLHELKYLNIEIKRSSRSERKYWKKRRLRLWFSLLPFIKY